MKIHLNSAVRRTVTEANINYYATPFVHPKRSMGEHDFIYLLAGEWKIGQNDEVFELKKDTLLILSAGQTHFGVSPCLPDTKTMYFHVSEHEGDTLAPDGMIDSLTDASANRQIKKIFHEIVGARLSGNDRKASVLFDLLLCELQTAGQHQGDTAIGERIKTLIHQSPERFYSNGELADKLGVSVKTAESKFKAAFGVTIHRYMLQFKADQAMAYFRNFPEMSVKEIAYNLGFYDEYHFSKQFKKVTGISPSAYKRIP